MINIIKGWYNHLKYKLGYLSPELIELSVMRLTKCFSCEHLTKCKTCNLCGCYVNAKSKVYTEDCPDNRWMPVHYFDDKDFSTIIVTTDVPPLLRGLLYTWLGSEPETIPLERWEEFLQTF